MPDLDDIQALIPSEWTLLAIFSAILTVLAVLGAVLKILDNLGAPVREIWPWGCSRLKATYRILDVGCRWLLHPIKRVAENCLRFARKLKDRWRKTRLKRGWTKMKLDLRFLIDEINRESSVETIKLCVAIKLGGVVSQIDGDGKATIFERTMIAFVKDKMDKAVLVNAHGRNTSKYTLFLANLASAIVDKWDPVYKSEGVSLSDEIERPKSLLRLDAWLSDYEIPHKVLMDYLGDVFDCEGEWVRSEK